MAERTFAVRTDGMASHDLCSGTRVDYGPMEHPDWISHGYLRWTHLVGREGHASLRPEGRQCVYRRGAAEHRFASVGAFTEPCPWRAHADEQGALWLLRRRSFGTVVERWVAEGSELTRD